MPPHMPELLTSPQYSSQFQSPSQNENDQNPPSNSGRIFGRNGPIFGVSRPTTSYANEEENPPSYYGRMFSRNNPIFGGNRPTPPTPSYISQQRSFPRSSGFPRPSTAENSPYSDRNRRSDRIFEERRPWPIRQFPPPFSPQPPRPTPIFSPALLERRWPVLQLSPRRTW